MDCVIAHGVSRLHTLEDSRASLRVIALVLAAVMLASLLLLCTPMTPAFCEDGDEAEGDKSAGDTITGAMSSAADSVYSVFKKIVLLAATIVISIAGFVLLLGGKNCVENAKRILFSTVGGVAIVLLAPLFAREIGSWFGGRSLSDTVNGVIS